MNLWEIAFSFDQVQSVHFPSLYTKHTLTSIDFFALEPSDDQLVYVFYSQPIIYKLCTDVLISLSLRGSQYSFLLFLSHIPTSSVRLSLI